MHQQGARACAFAKGQERCVLVRRVHDVGPDLVRQHPQVVAFGKLENAFELGARQHTTEGIVRLAHTDHARAWSDRALPRLEVQRTSARKGHTHNGGTGTRGGMTEEEVDRVPHQHLVARRQVRARQRHHARGRRVDGDDALGAQLDAIACRIVRSGSFTELGQTCGRSVVQVTRVQHTGECCTHRLGRGKVRVSRGQRDDALLHFGPAQVVSPAAQGGEVDLRVREQIHACILGRRSADTRFGARECGHGGSTLHKIAFQRHTSGMVRNRIRSRGPAVRDEGRV